MHEAAVMSVSKLADDAAAEVPEQQGSDAAYAALLAKANEVREPVCQLLQQSGISREIAVLAAALTRRVPVGKDPDSIAVQTALTRFYPVLETYIDHLKEYVQGMGGEQERQQLPEQQQRLLQLRLSLAVTLLHEAAAAPWEDAPTGASEAAAQQQNLYSGSMDMLLSMHSNTHGMHAGNDDRAECWGLEAAASDGRGPVPGAVPHPGTPEPASWRCPSAAAAHCSPAATGYTGAAASMGGWHCCRRNAQQHWEQQWWQQCPQQQRW